MILAEKLWREQLKNLEGRIYLGGQRFGKSEKDVAKAIQDDVDILTRLNERLKVRFG